MDGRKLGFALGVFIVVITIGVTAFIDRSHAPTDSDGRELDPPSQRNDDRSTSDRDGPLTDRELRRTFGGITITQAGGIAGINDVVHIGTDLRARFTSRSGTQIVALDSAERRSLLRGTAELAAAGSFEAPESEPYPDELSTTIEFVWDGEQLAGDPSSPQARRALDLFDDIRTRARRDRTQE